jgi:hypothetical protein
VYNYVVKNKKQWLIDLVLNYKVLGALLVLFVLYFIASIIGLIPEPFAYGPVSVPIP